VASQPEIKLCKKCNRLFNKGKPHFCKAMLQWVTSFPDDSTTHPYRYSLTRKWEETPYVLWVLANPSTASSEIDDKTIFEVCRFTDRLTPYRAIVVVNIYAMRATKATNLRTKKDLNGESDGYIKMAVEGDAALNVVGWGGVLEGVQDGNETLDQRIQKVESMLSSTVPTKCLGINMDKTRPIHPIEGSKRTIMTLESWPPS
jgi:hypothetical protein